MTRIGRFHGRGGGRYATLLLTLVALIFLFPAFNTDKSLARFAGLVFLAVIGAGLHAASRSRRRLYLGLAIAIPSAILLVGESVAPRAAGLEVAGYLGVMVFLVFTLSEILRDVVRQPEVTWDLVLGAVCVYLLLGTAWGIGYGILFEIDPGHFSVHAEHAMGESGYRGLWVYYSFVTLTTLGYGDIIPTSVATRTLAAFEAVVGQLYLALTIGRLIGLYVSRRSADPGA